MPSSPSADHAAGRGVPATVPTSCTPTRPTPPATTAGPCAGAVAASVERHLAHLRPVALSQAALEVLAVVAYRQPVSQAGIEHISGASSDGALARLLQRGLVVVDEHRLVRTTPEFLQYLGLRDLADLPALPDPDPSAPAVAAARSGALSSGSGRGGRSARSRRPR